MTLRTNANRRILSMCLLTAAAAGQATPKTYDVVVYGGTSAGIVAAIQADLDDKDVALVAPNARLGGLSTCGLGATDVGNAGAIGGLSREFYRRIRKHYARASAWTEETPGEFRGRGHHETPDAAWTFEPKVALQVFESWLADTGVEVVRDCRLRLRRDAVVMDDAKRRIVSFETVDGRVFRGRAFIDATYEGDLMAMAGVEYRVGREARSEFGETLNGVSIDHATKHQFSHNVDPYVVPGDPDSGLLPWISADGPGENGAADARVQAYCFRLCTTDVVTNRVPWSRPDDYDPARYELLLRNFDAGDGRVPWHPVWMPNRKTDTNNNFAISTDAIGLSWRWPEADWNERAAIFAAHLSYTEGLLYTLAHHDRVPESVRAHYRRLGRAKDEFVESDHWPPQLYVREGRRMVGAVVMTEHHCYGKERIDDPVGLGAYAMDSHNVQRYVDTRGRVRNEGDVQVRGFDPYGVSLRAIVPKRDHCTNLAVPVAVSASHIAFGSIRMEPVFMVLAQSAAMALTMALDSDTAVQDIDYPELARRLEAAGQKIRWTPSAAEGALSVDEIPGTVVDDEAATFTGTWSVSRSVKPFVGRGYRHDGAGQAGATATFTFDVEPGRYGVEIAYQPHANRSRAVQVRIQGSAEPFHGRIDQTAAPSVDGLWHRITIVDVRSAPVQLVLSGDPESGGYVVIDAARLVKL